MVLVLPGEYVVADLKKPPCLTMRRFFYVGSLENHPFPAFDLHDPEHVELNHIDTGLTGFSINGSDDFFSRPFSVDPLV